MLIAATNEKEDLLRQLIEIEKAEKQWWGADPVQPMDVVDEPLVAD